jgi:hypothetical protein
MHQLSHKAIERIHVGRRHAGKDYIGGVSLRFVASLDLWEKCCRPDKVRRCLELPPLEVDLLCCRFSPISEIVK